MLLPSASALALFSAPMDLRTSAEKSPTSGISPWERCPVEWRCFLPLGVVLDDLLLAASQSSPDDDEEDVFRVAVAAAGDLQR